MAEVQKPKQLRDLLSAHLGLFFGLGASFLIALKILAVARWDVDIALALLDAHGTANVLSGTLLSMFPYFVAIAYLLVAPWLEKYLSTKTSVERAAAEMTHVLILMLVMFIVPIAYLIMILVMLCLRITRRLTASRRLKKGSHKERSSNDKSIESENRVSFFEWAAVQSAIIVSMVVGLLQVPWVPAEIASIEGEPKTVYVFDRGVDTSMLMEKSSGRIMRIESSLLSGELCEVNDSWLTDPILHLLKGDQVVACPKGESS